MVTLATSTIVREAMFALERNDVSSLTDDSEMAEDFAMLYPKALDRCLAASDWSFARKYVVLPEAAPDTPPAVDPDLPHLYLLPGDCVTVRWIYDQPQWRLDGDFLRADRGETLRIRYTQRTEDEAKMPALFLSAVALALAIPLAPRWLSTRTKRADLYSMAKEALAEAKRADRGMSSGARWDGRDNTSDWVEEARR